MRLIAIKQVERSASGNKQWRFRCDCGKTTIARIIDVKRGFKKSCGCLHRETSAANGRKSSLTHGMFGTPEYNTWAQMIQRCTNPKNTSWDSYGGRKISVCKRWRKFENFLADMGRRPSPKHSIHRTNNDGNYEPKNCRWATQSEQAKNKLYTPKPRDKKSGRIIKPAARVVIRAI